MRPAALVPRPAPAGGRAWERSFEPVVEVDLGALAKVGAEAALAAQPGQRTGARARDYEPVAADDIAGHGTGVLEQERARPAVHRPGDPLDAHEARRPIRPGSLEELDHAVAGNVAAEAFLHVDPRQHWALGRLFV